MNVTFFTFSVAVLWTVCLAVEEIEKDDGVLVLTTKNWDQALSKHKTILVEFYAPWCGHCKALAPEYVKAAKKLHKEKIDVVLGKVDVTAEKELGEKHQVKGYPTLKFFKNGKDFEYTGGRTADDIVNWLKKKTGPPATTLKSVDQAKDFVDEAEVVVIGFFKDVASKKAKVFLQVASARDDIQFAITSDKALFKEYDVDKDNTIVLLKKFDNLRDVYEGKFEEESITAFITENSLPLVVEFNRESAQKIFGGAIENHLLLFIGKSHDEAADKTEIMRTAAKTFKGKVLFVTIDTDVAENERLLTFFAMKKEDAPTLRLIQPKNDMLKYKPESAAITLANIKQFVQNVLDKKLQPHRLSQDIPDDWDKKPVKVLTSKNFNKVAMNKDKDVLVEFYAPWCGHCKKLVPIYDELGENFKDHKSVVIAKMDATVNELEEVKVKSFPTIRLFKKTTNEVVEYTGEKDLKGLTEFLERGGEEEAKDEDEEDIKSKDEL